MDTPQSWASGKSDEPNQIQFHFIRHVGESKTWKMFPCSDESKINILALAKKKQTKKT